MSKQHKDQHESESLHRGRQIAKEEDKARRKDETSHYLHSIYPKDPPGQGILHRKE